LHRYDGKGTPAEHLDNFLTLWKMKPLEEWPHHFISTLEGIPTNSYVEKELRRGTTEWTTLQNNFIVTFSFEHDNPNIDSTLKKIRGVIFIKELEVELIIEYQQ
jgi:hypothetical protein